MTPSHAPAPLPLTESRRALSRNGASASSAAKQNLSTDSEKNRCVRGDAGSQTTAAHIPERAQSSSTAWLKPAAEWAGQLSASPARMTDAR